MFLTEARKGQDVYLKYLVAGILRMGWFWLFLLWPRTGKADEKAGEEVREVKQKPDSWPFRV